MRQHYSNKTKTDAGGGGEGGDENTRARPSNGLPLTFKVTFCLPANISTVQTVHMSQMCTFI